MSVSVNVKTPWQNTSKPWTTYHLMGDNHPCEVPSLIASQKKTWHLSILRNEGNSQPTVRDWMDPLFVLYQLRSH